MLFFVSNEDKQLSKTKKIAHGIDHGLSFIYSIEICVGKIYDKLDKKLIVRHLLET